MKIYSINGQKVAEVNKVSDAEYVLAPEMCIRDRSSSIFCYESRCEEINLLAWLYPCQELLVVHAFEVGTLHVVDNAPRALLLLDVYKRQL